MFLGCPYFFVLLRLFCLFMAWIASSASTEQWIFTGGSLRCEEMSVFLILRQNIATVIATYPFQTTSCHQLLCRHISFVSFKTTQKYQTSAKSCTCWPGENLAWSHDFNKGKGQQIDLNAAAEPHPLLGQAPVCAKKEVWHTWHTKAFRWTLITIETRPPTAASYLEAMASNLNSDGLHLPSNTTVIATSSTFCPMIISVASTCCGLAQLLQHVSVFQRFLFEMSWAEHVIEPAVTTHLAKSHCTVHASVRLFNAFQLIPFYDKTKGSKRTRGKSLDQIHPRVCPAKSAVLTWGNHIGGACDRGSTAKRLELGIL